MRDKTEKQEIMYHHTAGQAKRFITHFDSHFTRIMGRGNYGGSAVGECYETASRIVDGDFQSYTNAWEVTARRVEAIGWDCLTKGHKVSARDAFLRATTYWGALTMYVSPTDPRQRSSYEKARTCFREAAKLCDPVIEISGNAFGISDLFPISCLIGLKIPPSKLGPWVRFPSTDSTGRRTGCAPPAGCYDPEGDSHRPLRPF